MQVFITGGTGYVGSVVVEHLGRAGHEVTALARSREAERTLVAAGAVPVRGTLDDVAVLRSAAAAADAVVHTAAAPEPTAQAEATELAAVAALVAGAGAAGRGTPVVYTSTALVYGFDPAQDVTEDATLPALSAQPAKAAAERIVTGGTGITPVVLRPGLVHGRGGSGLVTGLVAGAAAAGAATYVGDGDNAWLPVHVDDLADLYVRVLARPVAGVFNVTGDEPFTFRELAEQIGALTGAPAVPLPLATAVERLGPLAHVLATTSLPPSDRARATYGWTPRASGLLEELRSGGYRVPALPQP